MLLFFYPKNMKGEHRKMKADKLLWLKAAGIRAVKTVAQTAIAL